MFPALFSLQALKAHRLFAVSMSIALLFNITEAQAAEQLLEWDTPDSYTDDAPLTDLGGFLIYSGTESGKYTDRIDVGTINSYKITGLDDGKTYYFSVTAYDAYGNESSFSNELSKTIPLPPSPPEGSPLTIADAVDSLRIATGLLPATEADLKKLDLAPVVNGHFAPDGKVDIADALAILRLVMGL